MPQTWVNALDQYSYPVKLACYANTKDCPAFFNRQIEGRRNSTIDFEAYFQTNIQEIEVWCEVVFWKLYSSQRYRRDTNTKKCWDFWISENITTKDLYNAANNFIVNNDRNSFDKYRRLWPFQGGIAVLATPISFLAPDYFPMIDTRIAKWVASQLDRFNERDPDGPQLRKSRYGQTASEHLTMADFDFYLHWICWTQHTANKLSQQTKMKWRARDVEMAVYTAWGDKGYSHPRLPLHPI